MGGCVERDVVAKHLHMIEHRGPDDEGIWSDDTYWTLAHTRLAIQGIADEASRQPVTVGDCVVTYNGEMWRPEDLPGSGGDTPRVAALIAEHGIAALPMLQRGMWALAWVDGQGRLTLARDAYGEVPLHVGRTQDRRIVYASEVAALLALGASPRSVRWVSPGTWVRFGPGPEGSFESGVWTQTYDLSPRALDDPVAEVATALRRGVMDRMRSDREVAVLVSGGLDSSATLGTLVGSGVKVRAYTAVHDPRSADLRHARIVTEALGVPLTEVAVPKPDAAMVDRALEVSEMPHKAQTEIAIACLALAERLAEDGVAVILSGEGSDELWASYGMSFHGIKQDGWHRHRYKTFIGQHRKNFARTNKVFMRHGVEARLPFLDDGLVRTVLRMPENQVRQVDGRKHAKAVLAAAAEHLNANLPEGSLWRSKAAFQKEAGIDRSVSQIVDAKTYSRRFDRLFGGVKV